MNDLTLFPHQKLDVYRLSLSLAQRVRGARIAHAELRDQAERARVRSSSRASSAGRTGAPRSAARTRSRPRAGLDREAPCRESARRKPLSPSHARRRKHRAVDEGMNVGWSCAISFKQRAEIAHDQPSCRKARMPSALVVAKTVTAEGRRVFAASLINDRRSRSTIGV